MAGGSSVTRFGKFSPLWQKFTSLWLNDVTLYNLYEKMNTCYSYPLRGLFGKAVEAWTLGMAGSMNSLVMIV